MTIIATPTPHMPNSVKNIKKDHQRNLRKLKMSKKPIERRFVFVEDEEQHWYIIPVSQKEKFGKWLEFYGESEDWDGPDFHKCRCKHPSRYLITSYEELKHA
jgi:hypothetical protein